MPSSRILKPGSRHIVVDRIKAATNVREVLLHKGGSFERAGTMTEEIDLVDAMGIPVIRRVTSLESKKLGNQRTMSVVEASSLRPLAYEAHLSTLDVSARYQDGRVTGMRKQGNHTQIGSGLEIPGDVFDIGSIELLILAIEFSEGWKGKFNIADPLGGRVARGQLEVIGKETAGGRACWVVVSTIGTARVEYRVDDGGTTIASQSFSPRKGVTIEFV